MQGLVGALTIFLSYINWKILQISQDILEINIKIYDETVIIREETMFIRDLSQSLLSETKYMRQTLGEPLADIITT